MREKLIEILKKTPIAEINGHIAEAEVCFVPHVFESMADHLLANGVTIQRWIPVTERLPGRAGMAVLLVAVNRYGQRTIVKGFTNYECPVEFLTTEKPFDNCWQMWKVTHWMPLPEPPEEG